MAESTRYLIPAQAVDVVTEIKRSRFVAHIAHSHNTDSALQIISREKARHPDARHHCWAFIACPPLSASAIRFSDDGEPSGTAGKPILNVLQYSHYGEIICVISRYFGGIKLGAGGLIRAYSNSTQAALEKLSVKEIVQLSEIEIQFDYPFESSIRHYLQSNNININHVGYEESVIFQLEIEKNQIPQLMQQARNLCKGQVHLVKVEPGILC
ncbi:MAG: YigZ family protein [gamma proteobacterium symbiont of Bathyaustriella thionipta]|nr:YigZ family protein [gamma proteobacterium symbiont of Bathyaustriella thionipta]MCU7950165.1 YigZ family protein [gamma proteobacterium symbiont of Bathyaustriella thionipta]MCU7953759.1 YigZ family protein [gamma proteobacterium symbiont of Bathyaustriella thionipta]MCU7956779.1 YigZ family protein [gamma proteobacterium symbiont of Bathyaustriella thionipta]MCU7967490.1 YigZ family protein [gamma proteobacterium symbiont of Bathyaustriella thionipta]